jgi:RHS repeat-associated protein
LKRGSISAPLFFYLPFGETLSGSVPTDKLFTGQRLDSTGLYYYNARYYDAMIGRFISPDTVIPNPSNPQCFNRYSYVLNNPLRYTDPSGHGLLDKIAKFIKKIIVGGGGSGDSGTGGGGNTSSSDKVTPKLPIAPKRPVVPTEPEPAAPSFKINVWKAGVAISVAIAANDFTGIGVVDDIAIPFILVVAKICSLFERSEVIISGSNQDHKLTNGEIERLKKGGVDPHDLKQENPSTKDLYKDQNGNIIVKPKGGNGPGEPTGLNINDY